MKTWLTQLRGSEFKVMRLNESAALAPDTMDCAQTIAEFLRPRLAASLIYRPDVENFIVVHLSARKKPIGFEVISNGTLDTILVTAREVFKSAIITNAHSIVLAHNHPSGDPTPSDADIKVTRDLFRAGQLLKIEVLDHIILGLPSPETKGCSSLRELGYCAV